MSRLVRVLLSALVVLCVTAAPAAATPSPRSGSRLLGQLWTYLLETPTSDNPFTGGDPCVRQGRTVVPFAPLGTATLTCTVPRGADVFVAALTVECSTVEPPPFFGRTPAELWACARENLDGYRDVSVLLDGRPVPLSRVQTGTLRIELPVDDVLGTTESSTRSVGAGEVALLRHLRPGTHTVAIHAVGPDGSVLDNTTTLVVGRH